MRPVRIRTIATSLLGSTFEREVNAVGPIVAHQPGAIHATGLKEAPPVKQSEAKEIPGINWAKPSLRSRRFTYSTKTAPIRPPLTIGSKTADSFSNATFPGRKGPSTLGCVGATPCCLLGKSSVVFFGRLATRF